MSIVRLGPWLCETDKTHSFSPRAIFGEGNAALTLIAPCPTADDLAHLTIPSDVGCVRVESAPVVDHAGGKYHTGVVGHAPQFVVTPKRGYATLPACVRREVGKLSSRHFSVGCADLIDSPFVANEPAGASQAPAGSQPVASARSDVLRPATARSVLAGGATRNGRLFQRISEEALRRKESENKPYLVTQRAQVTDNGHHRSQGKPLRRLRKDEAAESDDEAAAHDDDGNDDYLPLSAAFADEWEERGDHHRADARHDVAGAEATFFAAYERAVKCAYGFDGHFPDADGMAVTPDEDRVITVAPVAADVPHLAADRVVRKRGCHFSMFVGDEPARTVVDVRRKRAKAVVASGTDEARTLAGKRGRQINGGFRTFMKEAGMTAKDAGKAWRYLSASEKLVYRNRAELELDGSAS